MRLDWKVVPISLRFFPEDVVCQVHEMVLRMSLVNGIDEFVHFIMFRMAFSKLCFRCQPRLGSGFMDPCVVIV